MRKKIFLGHMSSHALPFSLRSDYVWTICLSVRLSDNHERLLLETRGYTAIQNLWTFAFHLDDDLEGAAHGYRVRVQVLDQQVLIADAEQSFSIDWEDKTASVHNLVLQPQAI